MGYAIKLPVEKTTQLSGSTSDMRTSKYETEKTHVSSIEGSTPEVEGNIIFTVKQLSI